MKLKVFLMLLAVMSFAVLVVSAQTPRSQPRNDLQPELPRFGTTLIVPGQQSGYTNSFYTLSGVQSNEEANLANQASEVAQHFGSAKSEADREKLKSQLSTILEKQFEIRQQRHKKEIESLEAQIKKLRDLVRQASRKPPRDRRQATGPDPPGGSGTGMVAGRHHVTSPIQNRSVGSAGGRSPPDEACIHDLSAPAAPRSSPVCPTSGLFSSLVIICILACQGSCFRIGQRRAGSAARLARDSRRVAGSNGQASLHNGPPFHGSAAPRPCHLRPAHRCCAAIRPCA